MEFGLEEPILLTPTSYRRRKSSSKLKQNDDTFGSFLYSPSPIFSSVYKRGRKSSFLSRRHSDSLLPTHQNPYYAER